MIKSSNIQFRTTFLVFSFAMVVSLTNAQSQVAINYSSHYQSRDFAMAFEDFAEDPVPFTINHRLSMGYNQFWGANGFQLAVGYGIHDYDLSLDAVNSAEGQINEIQSYRSTLRTFQFSGAYVFRIQSNPSHAWHFAIGPSVLIPINQKTSYVILYDGSNGVPAGYQSGDTQKFEENGAYGYNNKPFIGFRFAPSYQWKFNGKQRQPGFGLSISAPFEMYWLQKPEIHPAFGENKINPKFLTGLQVGLVYAFK